MGHAEAALLMTREERNENYTFIYIDKEPGAVDTVTSPRPTAKTRPERKQRRSRGSGRAKDEAIPRRQQPRRQCSINSLEEPSSPNQGDDDDDDDDDDMDSKQQPHSPPEPDPQEPSPPPVRTPWRTAAARKLLPLSITMKKLNVEIIKCDWQLQKDKLDIPKKVECEERPCDQVLSPEVLWIYSQGFEEFFVMFNRNFYKINDKASFEFMSFYVLQGSSDKAEAETCSSEEERATSPAGWSDQESAEHGSPAEQSSGATTQMKVETVIRLLAI